MRKSSPSTSGNSSETMEKFCHPKRCGAYFEGWYFKLQTRGGDALALIPALHQDAAHRRSASLQVISREGSWWLEYPAADFSACEERLRIRAGENIFTEKGLRVNIDADGLKLRGAVGFGAFSRLCSDIMGPFSYVPCMECSHGVISMSHSLEGALSINGRTLDFTGGTGYIETDRGRSFPSSYLWAQCSWGGPERGGFMLSVATIPTLLGSFTGCICALVHEGHEYRLATYRGARVEHWSCGGAVIRQGRWLLKVELLDSGAKPLRAPVRGSMGRTVHESLSSGLRFCLTRDGETILEHTDNCAGFEYAEKSGA